MLALKRARLVLTFQTVYSACFIFLKTSRVYCLKCQDQDQTGSFQSQHSHKRDVHMAVPHVYYVFIVSSFFSTPCFKPGPNFMALFTAEFCANNDDSPLTCKRRIFCASLVSVECLETWSMHAQNPQFAANPWNTLAVSTEFHASVSSYYELTVSRAMKLGPDDRFEGVRNFSQFDWILVIRCLPVWHSFLPMRRMYALWYLSLALISNIKPQGKLTGYIFKMILGWTKENWLERDFNQRPPV